MAKVIVKDQPIVMPKRFVALVDPTKGPDEEQAYLIALDYNLPFEEADFHIQIDEQLGARRFVWEWFEVTL